MARASGRVSGGIAFLFCYRPEDRREGTLEGLVGESEFLLPVCVSRCGGVKVRGGFVGRFGCRYFLLSRRGGVLLVKSPARGVGL